MLTSSPIAARPARRPDISAKVNGDVRREGKLSRSRAEPPPPSECPGSRHSTDRRFEAAAGIGGSPATSPRHSLRPATGSRLTAR